MESAYWRTLVEVARAGSLSGAAETLCVTQSAVSRRVKFLEDQYGQELLARATTGVSLTAAGQLVVEKARQILELEEGLETGLAREGRRQKLTFACTPSFGLAHLPSVMREFLLLTEGMADLNFRLDTPPGVLQGLRAGTYDMAVIEHCDSLQTEEFAATALAPDSVVFVSAAVAGLPTGVLPVDRLFGTTLFTRQPGCCSRTLLEANLAKVGRTLSEFARVVVVDDLRALVEAVRSGDGVSFLSTDVVGDLLLQGELVAHEVAGFTHRRQRTLLHSADLGPCPHMGQFLRALARIFADAAPH